MKAEKVYKGPFKKDDVIKLSMGSYRKFVEGEYPLGKSIFMQNGDNVIVFFMNVGWTPARNDIFRPVSHGVRFISDGKVIGFVQLNSPGPAYLQNDESLSKYWLDAEEFREEVEKSVAKVKPIEEKFKQETSRKDIDWLMELLRERASELPADYYYGDYITAVACERIAKLRDPELTARALLCVKTPSGSERTINKGFRSAQGREFLLKVIADPNEPMEKRVAYAGILAVAGEFYYYTYTIKDARGGWRVEDESKGPNAGYITRIARLALDNVKHDKLCAALTGSIYSFARSSFARSISQRREENTTTDMMAAIPVLEKVYKSTKSDVAKLKIELILGYMDKSALRRINPGCGPVVSVIKQLKLRHRDKDEQSLFVDYVAYDFAEKPIELTPYVVLKNTASDDEYYFSLWENRRRHYKDGPPTPTGTFEDSRDQVHSFDGTQVIQRGCSIILPKDIPGGKYRVYVEYREGETVVSKGHYREIDI